MLRPFNPDINLRDRLLATPLFYAVNHGNLEMVKLLIDAGADVNAKDRVGVSLAYFSIGCSTLEILKYLVDHGASLRVPKCPTENLPLKKYPLIKAVNACKDEMVEYLLTFPEILATIDCKSSQGVTAIHYACYGTHSSPKLKTLNKVILSDCPRSVEMLLDAGADVPKFTNL